MQEEKLRILKMIIDLTQLDFEQLIDLIEKGAMTENLVDIEVDDPKEGNIKVEIYVD